MKFFAAKNAVTKTVTPSEPWSFKTTEKITEEIRKVRSARQDWLQNIDTNHCLYTAFEGTDPGCRPSKDDNPPVAVHAFVADYDIVIPAQRISEAISAMTIKPHYFESSLGGKFRLIWTLSVPIRLNGYDFAAYLQKQAHKWLALDILPGLDEPAFLDPNRLYCRGDYWEEVTGGGDIEAAKVQAFYVEAVKKFHAPETEESIIPLSVVEEELKKQFKNFNWPSGFDLNSQGPSFWVEGSTSPMSAIVKEGGMFTFSAHASKTFYNWTDLLGKDFTKVYKEDSIARATANIYYDGKSFWKHDDEGFYSPNAREDINDYWSTQVRLSQKSVNGEPSLFAQARSHVIHHQRVKGAGPFVFVKPGLHRHEGRTYLNTYDGEPIQPAVGTQKWGEHGEFPFISNVWLPNFFDPFSQLEWFLAWHQWFYRSALDWRPRPGHNIFILGATGNGKTLLNRNVIGVSVGGFVDASSVVVNNEHFNAHLYHKAHWVIDDDTPANSPQAIMKLQAALKKVAANQQSLVNEKFQNSCMVEWAGRLGITANLDFISMKIMAIDNSSLDKACIFRCSKNHRNVRFPLDRHELELTLRRELPFYLRYLIDFKWPDYIIPDNRYGFCNPFHEKSLLDQAYQNSDRAMLYELLIEIITVYFQAHPESKCWRIPVSRLVSELSNTPLGMESMRGRGPDNLVRTLDNLLRSETPWLSTEGGSHNTKVWVFHRDAFLSSK